MYDVDKVAKQIREYKIMRDELNELIEQLQDEAKQQMTVQGVDELTGQESRISWHAVQSSALDAKALRRDFPDLADKYTLKTTVRRFVLA